MTNLYISQQFTTKENIHENSLAEQTIGKHQDFSPFESWKDLVELWNCLLSSWVRHFEHEDLTNEVDEHFSSKEALRHSSYGYNISPELSDEQIEVILMNLVFLPMNKGLIWINIRQKENSC